jgi:hypothetical protein
LSENQPIELIYKELQKNGKQVTITFRKICPYSSATKKDQTEKKKGISIVFFFKYDRKQIRDYILYKIHDLHYGFVPTKNLHCTFLTLSSKDSFPKPNYYFTDLIKEQIKKFLKARKN